MQMCTHQVTSVICGSAFSSIIRKYHFLKAIEKYFPACVELHTLVKFGITILSIRSSKVRTYDRYQPARGIFKQPPITNNKINIIFFISNTSKAAYGKRIKSESCFQSIHYSKFKGKKNLEISEAIFIYQYLSTEILVENLHHLDKVRMNKYNGISWSSMKPKQP